MKNTFKKCIVAILTLEARVAIAMHHPRIVAVTGSVGKTSTKDAVAAALAASAAATVRKSQKSFNSDFGVPLAILNLKNAWNNPIVWLWRVIEGFFEMFSFCFPKILVLEIGADHPGDIRSIAKWLPADVVVFTRMSDVPVHVEFFGSPEKVFEEKISLIGALKKEGTIVVNADDKKFMSAAQRSGKKFIAYGAEHTDTKELPKLAALSVCSALHFDMEKAKKALMSYVGPTGRMKMINGIKGSTIIDDTYNSSPIALESALHALSSRGGRRIAVLGNMAELGGYSRRAHYEAGKLVAKSADILFAVGLSAKDFVRGARDAGMPPAKIYEFRTSVEAGKKLLQILRASDSVLIKGSQSARMEKAVKMIMLEKHLSKHLLVRQESEWNKR